MSIQIRGKAQRLNTFRNRRTRFNSFDANRIGQSSHKTVEWRIRTSEIASGTRAIFFTDTDWKFGLLSFLRIDLFVGALVAYFYRWKHAGNYDSKPSIYKLISSGN
jgi:hypothetical protein